MTVDMTIDGSEAKDMLISRINRFDFEVVRWFVLKNRLRYKDVISLFARLCLSRGEILQTAAFDAMDTEFKKWLKERADKGDDEAIEMLNSMDFVKRYLGFGLLSVRPHELREIQRKIMDAKLEQKGEGK